MVLREANIKMYMAIQVMSFLRLNKHLLCTSHNNRKKVKLENFQLDLGARIFKHLHLV